MIFFSFLLFLLIFSAPSLSSTYKALTADGRVVLLQKSEQLRTSALNYLYIEKPKPLYFIKEVLINRSYGIHLSGSGSLTVNTAGSFDILLYGITLSNNPCRKVSDNLYRCPANSQLSYSSTSTEGRIVLMSADPSISISGGDKIFSLGTSSSVSTSRGDGVVVAVIDSGINWCLPTFLKDGGGSKILFYYDVKNSTELTRSEIERRISAGNCNYDDIGHGTAVADIASSIASGAELLIVDINNGSAPKDVDLIKALRYIKDKQRTLNRPVVVNISLTTHDDPHDGTGFMDRVIDEVSGSGFIVVTGAGNEGDTNMHASLKTTDPSATVQLRVQKKKVTGWYAKGTTYDIRLCISGTCETAGFGTSRQLNIGNCLITVKNDVSQHPLNGDGYIEFNFDCPLPETVNLTFTRTSGTETSIDLYISYPFSILQEGFLSGVPKWGGWTLGSVGSPGTSKSAITVGAIISRPSRTTRDFTFYSLGLPAPFSSAGPTRDGRTKPDISAGGIWVWTLSPSGSYIPNAGTSFSSPAVAGLVALYLQENPNATPADVRNWLILNAVRDISAPEEIVGFGKASWKGGYVYEARQGGGGGGCSSGTLPLFIGSLALLLTAARSRIASIYLSR